MRVTHRRIAHKQKPSKEPAKPKTGCCDVPPPNRTGAEPPLVANPSYTKKLPLSCTCIVSLSSYLPSTLLFVLPSYLALAKSSEVRRAATSLCFFYYLSTVSSPIRVTAPRTGLASSIIGVAVSPLNPSIHPPLLGSPVFALAFRLSGLSSNVSSIYHPTISRR